MREETGLEIEIERLVGVYVKKRESDLVFVFAATVAGGNLQGSKERDAARFFHVEVIPVGTSEHDRTRIGDAMATYGRAVLRVQPSRAT